MYENGYMHGWAMNGTWGLTHFLVFAVMAALILYPIGLILRKLGYSPFWAALACLPIVNIIGLWVVAIGRRSSDAGQLKTSDSTGNA